MERLINIPRYVFGEFDSNEVPLHREMDFARDLLVLEQVRFQDRLRVEIGYSRDVRNAAVPHLILQPLLASVVEHRDESSASPRICISITAKLINMRLELAVRNVGATFADGKRFEDIRSRLHQLYGDSANLALSHPVEEGTEFTLTLPLRILEDPTGRSTQTCTPAAPIRTG